MGKRWGRDVVMAVGQLAYCFLWVLTEERASVGGWPHTVLKHSLDRRRGGQGGIPHEWVVGRTQEQFLTLSDEPYQFSLGKHLYMYSWNYIAHHMSCALSKGMIYSTLISRPEINKHQRLYIDCKFWTSYIMWREYIKSYPLAAESLKSDVSNLRPWVNQYAHLGSPKEQSDNGVLSEINKETSAQELY